MSSRPTLFGQVVIGPPGSGKTTYCNAMANFLRSHHRKVVLVNLDPANDVLPYDAAIDISNLITVDDVMENLKLGPNGGLVYCMEYLEKNTEWLFIQIEKHKDSYFIFDFPGQVELYTHNNAVKNILHKLEKFGFRLCAVHLVDSHYCSDAGKFVSVLLTSLSTMLQIELPHVNVLSKVDLAEQYGKLRFNIDFFSEVLDLNYLIDALDTDPFTKKYYKLNAALVDVIENYGLVSFIPLAVNDPKRMQAVRSAVDKANGYIYKAGEARSIQSLLSCAVEAQPEYERFGEVTEKYLAKDDGRDASNDNQMETE